jgi:hypothetical protein
VFESYGDEASLLAEPVKPVSAIAGKSTAATPAGSVATSCSVKSPVAAGL